MRSNAGGSGNWEGEARAASYRMGDAKHSVYHLLIIEVIQREMTMVQAFSIRGLLTTGVLTLLVAPVMAQTRTATAPDVGVRFNPPSVVAFTNAHIVVSSQQEIDSGTLVVENGRIKSVGSDIAIPAGADVIDCGGDYLYPAFIDSMVEVESNDYSIPTGHWNPTILPGRQMQREAKLDDAKIETLRKAGIAIALVAPDNGIIKGQSSVMTTASGGFANNMLRERAFQHMRLYPSRDFGRTYPNSPMGAVALLRQVLSDSQWYHTAMQAARAKPSLAPPETNMELESLLPVIQAEQRVIIDGTNVLYALRADRLAREFSMDAVIRGSGQEYQQLDAIGETGRTFILPVNFPDAPKVGTLYEAADATLQELMHWHFAPENPSRMHAAGIKFVLTSLGLEKPTELLGQVRKAVERGLDESAALSAMTSLPAQLLEIDDVAGTLERGKLANVLRTDGPLFAKKTKLKETWVQGERFNWSEESPHDLSGQWALNLEGSSFLQLDLVVGGKPEKPTARLGMPGKLSDDEAEEDDAEDEKEDDVEDDDSEDGDEEEDESDAKGVAELKDLKVSEYQISASFEIGDLIEEAEGTALLSGVLLKHDGKTTLSGSISWPDGTESTYEANQLADKDDDQDADDDRSDAKSDDAPESDEAKDDSSEEAKEDELHVEVTFPLGAYGRTEVPEQPEVMVFQNATIWTSGDAGVLESADMLVRNGLIDSVGKQLAVPDGATVIDATGLHISPGIIDCHSHMATDGGVNESGQAVTAEVRIGDFIDPNDITIYRQLAGGVTTSNILHGSANPIGGQNQVIKLRWGAGDEELKMAEAPGGIKFALGENVKQSSREDSTRYPRSRMGVEQILRDRFEAAKDYRQKWSEWPNNATALPPRRDYELDAIVEILEGKRWVHCHSYRQDEILTTLRVLEDYGVTIGSLQHILEGYKVADAMAKHGATGSSFSDWWAYKFEVYDAIPFNGALMHRAGVVVSFNSDDRELARHLNHEAAKAVKYGGVSESEALKFVTLNPAKQLRIDQWVGSLEPGKHADFVVWNRSPLSTLSACQQTWIDGRKYFDRDEDLVRRQTDLALRMKLIQKIVGSGAKTSKGRDDDPSYWWVRFDEFCHHGHGEDHDEDH